MRAIKGVVLAVLLLVAVIGARAGGEFYSLQIRNGALRATPSFLGKVSAKLAYGDRVELLAEQGPWSRVRAEGAREGWIHASALSEKRIVLSAGDESLEAAASGDELALAGKGFNAEVEAEYRTRHEMDYTWVDRMETFRVSPEDAAAFLAEGGILPEGSDAR